MFGRKAKRIRDLEERVRFLEDKICPCEFHDWVATGADYVIVSGGYDFDVQYEYTCKKCGKKKMVTL